MPKSLTGYEVHRHCWTCSTQPVFDSEVIDVLEPVSVTAQNVMDAQTLTSSYSVLCVETMTT